MGSRTKPVVDDVVDFDSYLDNYIVQLQSNYSQQIRASQQTSAANNLPKSSAQNVGVPAYGIPVYHVNPQHPFSQIHSNETNGSDFATLDGTYFTDSLQPEGTYFTESFQATVQQQTKFSHENEFAAQFPQKSHKRAGRENHSQVIESNTHGSESDNLTISGESDDNISEAYKSRRKRELPASEVERRHIALQEKNRRAQRRFREKQKNKLHELRAQIDSFSQKVTQLQSENTALYSRTSILEKVLDIRNEQIQALQETKEASPSFSQQVENTTDANLEKMKELSSEQIYKIYQTFAKSLSSKLSTDGELLDGTLEDIELLVEDMLKLLMRLCMVKPLETRQFIIFSRQGLGTTEEEVILYWKKVLMGVQLSEEDKQKTVELRQAFLDKRETIMDERKQLNSQIQASMSLDTLHEAHGITFVNAHEAVVRLRNNIRSEQEEVLDFIFTLFSKVFSPRDFATFLLRCYPAVPDALGMSSAIAIDLGSGDLPSDHQLAEKLQGINLQNSLVSPWYPLSEGIALEPSACPTGRTEGSGALQRI